MIVLLALAAGCGRGVGWLDDRDRSGVLVHRAAAKADQGDIAAAMDLYQRALDQNPALARVHLDLAILLHDEKSDYVRAIYHYSRYLELRPETDKRELIKNRIRLAEQAFAGKMYRQDRRVEERLAEMEEENRFLKKRLRVLIEQLRGRE